MLKPPFWSLLFWFSLVNAHAATSCNPKGTFDPTNPAGSGYALVFSDDFSNPNTVDLSATGNAGFNWYLTKFFGYETEPSSSFSFTSDGITITPTKKQGGYNIATVAPASNSTSYVGNAWGGGAYFEIKFKFDPTLVNFSNGYPSIWAESLEHATEKSHPPETPASFEHFIEDDFFEYNITWAPTVAYGTAIHDWYGQYDTVCKYGYLAGKTGFCDITNSGAGTPYYNFVTGKPDGSVINWNLWHTISQLWVPGNAANNYRGYVQNFLDGVAMYAGAGAFSPLSKVGWSSNSPSTFATLQNNEAAFSILDQQHLFIILGTGASQPFTIRFVHVWQLPC
jgi:hypothetical protein